MLALPWAMDGIALRGGELAGEREGRVGDLSGLCRHRGLSPVGA